MELFLKITLIQKVTAQLNDMYKIFTLWKRTYLANLTVTKRISSRIN